MADNFDLRKFLTENKLTKNTQLLKEESDISGYWVMYGGLNKGIKEFIKMFPSQEEAQQALEDAPITYGQHVLRGYWGILPAQEWLASGGEIGPNQIGHPDRVPPKRLSPEELKAIRQLDFDAEMEREGVEPGGYDPDNEEWEDDEPYTGKYISKRDVEEGIHDRSGVLTRPLSNPAIEPLDRSPEELGKDADSRSENILRMTYRNQINDPNISDEELRYILSGKGVKGMGGRPNAVNNILASRSRMQEGTLDEALNKDIKAFGQDLGKYLTNAGFKVKYVNGRISDEDMKQVKTSTGLIALEPDQNEHQQSLFMYFNPKEVGKVEKIVNKFQLTPYSGRILARGWTAKQVQGALNPGDIYKYEDKPRGAYYFYRLAKVDRKVKDINEASYKVSKNSKEAQHLKKGDIIGSGEEVVSVSAGAKTPKGKVEVTLKTKDGKTKTSTWGKYTKVGVKEKETVKENTMTQRDKYLTRLVENALGLQVTEDDNVDYTMGRHDDLNQLPNPAPELNIPEGDEMVNEKPLPKYENIEKLMQEIDKSTDEEAHKFKMQEMKRVADMLEKKCTGLEEGDDADHIDQKKLKQMKKDIMALRKGIEKMEKLGEKKFAKKETKAELKEGFDLRKFLVENRLTTNSRILNENFNDQTSAIEKFINEPLLGGYFINTIEGPMHSIDLQIATEPDNHEGKKLTDFEILGTARYYPNEKWEFRNGGQPIKSGKMPKLASKTPADDKLLAIIAAEIDRATPAAQ